jgi:hypothetical protein
LGFLDFLFEAASFKGLFCAAITSQLPPGADAVEEEKEYEFLYRVAGSHFGRLCKFDTKHVQRSVLLS